MTSFGGVAHIANTPNQSFHASFFAPQSIHGVLRSLQQRCAFDDPLLLRPDNSLLQHRGHDVRLEVLLEELVLDRVSFTARSCGVASCGLTSR